MTTPEERLADFRSRLQPVADALRRGEPVDRAVIFALMRERFLEVDDISFDRRVERLVALAEVHRRVDDGQAIALYRQALALAPELDLVRRRLEWLEREVARAQVRGPSKVLTSWRRGIRAVAEVMNMEGTRQQGDGRPASRTRAAKRAGCR
jgi:hypothetical protein